LVRAIKWALFVGAASAVWKYFTDPTEGRSRRHRALQFVRRGQETAASKMGRPVNEAPTGLPTETAA
jgi:hypothetical protein